MLNETEKNAMFRVVKYLRERAGRLDRASKNCTPKSAVGEVARIKALGLVEAAAKIEEGIKREEL